MGKRVFIKDINVYVFDFDEDDLSEDDAIDKAWEMLDCPEEEKMKYFYDYDSETEAYDCDFD